MCSHKPVIQFRKPRKPVVSGRFLVDFELNEELKLFTTFVKVYQIVLHVPKRERNEVKCRDA